MDTDLMEGFNLRSTKTYDLVQRVDGSWAIYRLYINLSSPARHRVWQVVEVLHVNA